MSTTDLSTTIADVAASPRHVQHDAGSHDEHTLPDLIAADKYLRSKAVAATGTNPFKRLKKVVIDFGANA